MEYDERKEVVKIDLSSIQTSEELHCLLKEKLGFPDFYGMNWNAFWDTITGMIELPKRLLFTGWNGFSEKLPEDAKILKYYLKKYEETFNKYIECIIEYQA